MFQFGTQKWVHTQQQEQDHLHKDTRADYALYQIGTAIHLFIKKTNAPSQDIVHKKQLHTSLFLPIFRRSLRDEDNLSTCGQLLHGGGYQRDSGEEINSTYD